MFEEVHADVRGITKFLPRDDWQPHMRTILTNGGVTERKTGLKHADVVTAKMVRDERGWLRLAG